MDSLELKEVDPDQCEEAPEEPKFDFESTEGYETCKSILKNIEKLHSKLNLHAEERSYRVKFSKAYQVLYK